MGYTAWDTDLSRLVDADECVKKVKGHYLCPTEACRNIGVQLCLHECDNGNHFNSMPGYADKHVGACDFPQAQQTASQYRLKSFITFEIDDLITKLSSSTTKTLSEPAVRVNNHSHKSSSSSPNNITIDGINKLYNLVLNNDIKHKITPTITVGDICRDERNAANHKRERPNGVSLIIIGKTNCFDFKEKMLRVVCKTSQMEGGEAIKVYLYFDDESYQTIKKKLEQINAQCKGVSVAVLGKFEIEQKLNTVTGEPFDASCAYCNSKMIKILDRITPQIKTT